MAQRRMLSPDIVCSDAFLDMPVSSQCLYFHLSMRADDDGFVNPQMTIRMTGANSDDLKVLMGKRFVLPFDNGIIVIKHWRINNFIRRDRYKPTVYLEQRNALFIKENQSYTDNEGHGLPVALVPWKSDEEVRSTTGQPDVIPLVDAGKVRLGKVRLGKDRIGKDTLSPTATAVEPAVYDDTSFQAFWSSYPRKEGKGDAAKAWGKLKPSKKLAEQIVTSIEAHKATEQWQRENGRFVPHPATYLNQRRFDDEVSNTVTPRVSSF